MSEFQGSDNASTPLAPPAGVTSLYSKADGKWYYQTSAGVEKLVSNAADAGLGNVDNTADINKPISTPQQATLDTKQDILVAITASLPSLSFIDVAYFDNSKNPAWLDKTEDKSWYTQAVHTAAQYVQATYANDAAALTANAGIVSGDLYFNGTNFITYSTTVVTTRASQQKAASKGFITVEAGRSILWNSTGASPEMWAVGPTGLGTISSVAIEGPVIVIGSSTGVWKYDMVAAQWTNYNATGSVTYSASSFTSLGTAGASIATEAIVNAAVNGVDITFLPDAPIDSATGMRVPTIAVATNGGVSVIKDDGNVYDLTYVVGVDNIAYMVGFDLNGGIWWGSRGLNGNNVYVCREPTLPVADKATAPAYVYSSATTGPVVNNTAVSTVSALDVSGRLKFFGTNLDGISIVADNPTSPTNTMVAVINNLYNTGWMVGDIRRAYLCNSKTADRSVKAATLVENGTVTETVNAGGRNVYGGFSATSYFSEASHADWNALGTGDFSIIMSGVRWGNTAAFRYLFNIASGANGIQLYFNSGNTISLYIAGTTLTTTTTFTDIAAHVIEAKRISGVGYLLVDGNVVASGTAAGSISVSAELRIGLAYDGSAPWTGGQVACVRISATAPTAEQSKFIAATENALNGGAACLLSNSASVSALSHDASTDVLSVGNGTNVDQFKGLKRLSSAAHGVTTLTALASGSGDKLIVGTSGSFNRPAQDVNSELKAVQFELAEAKQGSEPYVFTSSGTTQNLPSGWKAEVAIWNFTDGTFAQVTQQKDGFIWQLTGLTTAKSYGVMIRRV